MRIWSLPLILVSASLLSPAIAQTALPAPQVEQIKVQLYYSLTGRLSVDIANDPDFMGWNTIIGEGGAEEPADDMLVSVRVTGDPHTGKHAPLKIVAKNGKGKIIDQRTVKAILFGSNGTAWVPMWLRDVGCVGRLNITVSMGKSVKTQTIDLHCGE